MVEHASLDDDLGCLVIPRVEQITERDTCVDQSGAHDVTVPVVDSVTHVGDPWAGSA